MKPINEYILIEPIKAEVSSSGLVVPNENPPTGIVLASSNKHIEEGQVVMYERNSGEEIKFKGKDVVFVKEENILARIEA